MTEFVILLLTGMGYLAYCVGVLLYRFFRWLISPILEEIRHRRVLEQEKQKEERLLEAHDRAREAIDQAVAHCVGLHEQAATRSDRQSGRRQSG
jgi:hypothetical protein